ncbi:MAG: RsmD family RNA methyltransferase [Lysobacter sp.]|nr:RsmD family RNA methyltransferase [Lysobacter sp.]
MNTFRRGSRGGADAGPPRSPRSPAKPGAAGAHNAQAGKVRIIGGHWRGTRLNVGDAPGLRPTSDRVRETAKPGAAGAHNAQAGKVRIIGGHWRGTRLNEGDAPGFDLAFVDPPFAAGLWDAVWPLLLPRLAPAAWLYVEAPADAAIELPAQWDRHREGATRDVRYALYRRRPA